MAVAFVKAHTVTSIKTAGAGNLSLTLSSVVPAGHLIVAAVVFDNAATAAKPIVSLINRAAGETNLWTNLGRAAYPNAGTAGAFSNGELWAIRTTVDWPATSYMVPLDVSVTMKASVALEFSGAEQAPRSGVTPGAVYAVGSSATTASMGGSLPAIGDLALGFLFSSNVAAAQAGDTDNLGGTWSTPVGVGSTGGSAATNNFGIVQYKVLTTASYQAYSNSVAVTAGNGSIITVLQATVDPVLSQAAYRFYDDGSITGATALAAQDTGITATLTSSDLRFALRTRLQETGGGSGRATDDYRLQWEKNASGTWEDVDPSRVLGPTYPSVNVTSQAVMNDVVTGYGQSFLGTDRFPVTGRFWLNEIGTATGTWRCAIYAHSGTFGVNGVPTGPPLAVTADTLSWVMSTSANWVASYFLDPPTLVAGTPYFLVVETTGATVGNGVGIGVDTTAPTDAGNSVVRNGSVWSANVAVDVPYEVYVAPSTDPIFAHDSLSLSDGDPVSAARLTGGTGTFVPSTAALLDAVVDNIGITANNHTELLHYLWLRRENLANGDVLRFRVLRNGATTGLTYTQVPTVTVAKAVAAVTQAAYQWFDEGTESGSVPYAAQDTAVTGNISNGDATGTLRIRLQSTTAVAAPATDDWALQYEKNASGTWVNVTNSTAVAATYDSPSLPAASPTTNRLTGGTGTFTAGEVSEDGVVNDIGLTGNGYTEIVYSLIIKAADLAQGDTVRFRVLRNGVTTTMTYSQTPVINLVKVTTALATAALAATTTVAAATTRTTFSPTTALAVTTSRSAAATRAAVSTTTALAVTTSRTAAATRTTLSTTSALTAFSFILASATRTTLPTTTALAVTTSRSAAATRTTLPTTTALAVATTATAAATVTAGGIVYTTATVPLAVTTTVAAAATRITFSPTTALAATTSIAATASRTTLPTPTALTVTTSRTAAATRTGLAAPTALAVTTSRTATVVKATAATTTSLAVTTSRTAAATRTGFAASTALAVTTTTTAATNRVTTVPTTALAVTTSRSATATRTALAAPAALTVTTTASAVTSRVTTVPTTALAVTTTATAVAVPGAGAQAALAVTSTLISTVVATRAATTTALAVTTSRTATVTKTTFAAPAALAVTTSRSAAISRVTFATTTALSVTTVASAAALRAAAPAGAALVVTTTRTATAVRTAAPATAALPVTVTLTATAVRTAAPATAALAVTTSRTAAATRTALAAPTTLPVTTSLTATVVKAISTTTTSLAVTTSLFSSPTPGGAVTPVALAVTTSRSAAATRTTFTPGTALAVVTSRSAAASRVTFTPAIALAVTTSRTATATRTTFLAPAALAVTTSRTASTSRVTSVSTTSLTVITTISAATTPGAAIPTVALNITTTRTAVIGRVTYTSTTTVTVTTTLSATTERVTLVPAVALSVLTSRTAELSVAGVIGAGGKVVVGGATKTVVTRWVIIGGAKRPVVGSSVVVGGVKHAVK